MSALLQLRDLSVCRGATTIVHPTSLDVEAGKILALTGQSGSGKSTIARAVMGLLPPGFTVSGQISFEGQDLLTLRQSSMRGLRGRRIGMVFQEPMTALNPIRRIGLQIGDTLRLHGMLSRSARRREVERLLDRVGLGGAEVGPHAYPHQLSGGQRQRVLLAIAIACRPALLIADEFTTALDSLTQAEVMKLVRGLVNDTGMAVLMISHDLGLIRVHADNVAVLRAGRLVEVGQSRELFSNPKNPYTRSLLAMSLDINAVSPLTPIPVGLLDADISIAAGGAV